MTSNFQLAMAHSGTDVRMGWPHPGANLVKITNTVSNVGKSAEYALLESLSRLLYVRRLDRQSDVHAWCKAAFGDDHAFSIVQRGVRHAEETIEAAQASGVAADMLHRLIDHVYAKPAGELRQEIAQSGITLLALAQAANVDADAEEAREFQRISSMPLDHFAQRNAAKNAAGFNVVPGAQQ